MEKVALPGGVTLAYDVFDFTDPWRKPEPLVFVHGFSKNRKSGMSGFHISRATIASIISISADTVIPAR